MKARQISLPESARWLESCDTMVALGSATRGRNTVFAKNSDRPQEEAQPLVMVAGSDHSGGYSGTQFIDVPQVGHTYRHVGSKPYWCAGYEHGFNEHQVVIGNEALPSKLKEAKTPKLVGMEVLRIGLERSRSAQEAVDVITGLVSEFGQGKFANSDGVRTYDNIYLIADPTSAYVVECVGHEWAVSQVKSLRSISNVSQIGDDGDRVSHGAELQATDQGLFNSGIDGQFSFSRVFGDLNDSASGIKRQCRSESMLNRGYGKLDVRSMMEVLSDHSDCEDSEELPVLDIKGDVSICLHRNSGESMGASTASLIADLCATGERLPVYWTGMYSPCMTVFMPVFIEGDLPPMLAVGGPVESYESPWWDFYRLTHYGMQAGVEARMGIRSELSSLQAELFDSAYEIAQQGRVLAVNGDIAALRILLTNYMFENARSVISKVKSMIPANV